MMMKNTTCIRFFAGVHSPRFRDLRIDSFCLLQRVRFSMGVVSSVRRRIARDQRPPLKQVVASVSPLLYVRSDRLSRCISILVKNKYRHGFLKLRESSAS